MTDSDLPAISSTAEDPVLPDLPLISTGSMLEILGDPDLLDRFDREVGQIRDQILAQATPPISPPLVSFSSLAWEAAVRHLSGAFKEAQEVACLLGLDSEAGREADRAVLALARAGISLVSVMPSGRVSRDSLDRLAEILPMTSSAISMD